jgi:hypothetical protein
MPKLTWNAAILEAVRELGGQNIALQVIYSEMQKSPVITPHHLDQWRTGGQARYECWIRRGLTTLIRKGMVLRVSKGTYSRITLA